MYYPAPLIKGSVIAITAFSAGIKASHEARYQHVVEGLKEKGFQIREGECLRGNHHYASAPAEQRAAELMSFLLDDTVHAIAAPWGGELAMELLPLLDFNALLKAKPKWLFGFSDISTITSVLTFKLKWASAHSANLMDLSPLETNALTANTLNYLATMKGKSFTQISSSAYSQQWPDICAHPKAILQDILQDIQATQWQWLVKPEDGRRVEGRLIGGCWDTLIHLFDTPYLDLAAYAQQCDEGILLYLENVEMTPADLIRAILSMTFKGVFKHIDALLLGRSAFQGSDDKDELTYHEVLTRHLKNAGVPVLIDMDIGHVPPNLTLINGAYAKIVCEGGQGSVTQFLV